ncbi:hypothetical protein HK097_000224, partial [Rhizophlyctis rosea]
MLGLVQPPSSFEKSYKRRFTRSDTPTPTTRQTFSLAPPRSNRRRSRSRSKSRSRSPSPSSNTPLASVASTDPLRLARVSSTKLTQSRRPSDLRRLVLVQNLLSGVYAVWGPVLAALRKKGYMYGGMCGATLLGFEGAEGEMELGEDVREVGGKLKVDVSGKKRGRSRGRRGNGRGRGGGRSGEERREYQPIFLKVVLAFVLTDLHAGKSDSPRPHTKSPLSPPFIQITTADTPSTPIAPAAERNAASKTISEVSASPSSIGEETDDNVPLAYLARHRSISCPDLPTLKETAEMMAQAVLEKSSDVVIPAPTNSTSMEEEQSNSMTLQTAELPTPFPTTSSTHEPNTLTQPPHPTSTKPSASPPKQSKLQRLLSFEVLRGLFTSKKQLQSAADTQPPKPDKAKLKRSSSFSGFGSKLGLKRSSVRPAQRFDLAGKKAGDQGGFGISNLQVEVVIPGVEVEKTFLIDETVREVEAVLVASQSLKPETKVKQPKAVENSSHTPTTTDPNNQTIEDAPRKALDSSLPTIRTRSL